MPVVVDVSERNFEEAVEAVLTAQPGEDRETPGDAEFAPGGYYRRRPDDHDRTLCRASVSTRPRTRGWPSITSSVTDSRR